MERVDVQALEHVIDDDTRGLVGGLGSGRTSKRDRRQVWLSDLEPSASDVDRLVAAFRAEVSA